MYIISAQVYNWKTDRYEPMFFYDFGWSTISADLFASKQGAENYYRVHQEELSERYKIKEVKYIEV
jgi:hypothetical protein